MRTRRRRPLHTARLGASALALAALSQVLALLAPRVACATEPASLATLPDAPARTRTSLLPAPALSQTTPAVVTLEAAPEANELSVVVRAPALAGSERVLARVPLVPGGAFRGAVSPRSSSSALSSSSGSEVFVAAQQRMGRGAETYQTALFRVSSGSGARLLVDGLTDASSPLLTARGTVLVQRGSAGPEPELAGQVLRERTDALRIDAVDPGTGAARTVWSGAGQLAYLATALRDDEALLYHLTDHGAFLVRIDASGARPARVVAGPFAPLARDFSYDSARDEVHYARAARDDRSGHTVEYELVAQPLSGAPARVTLRASSDRLMPRALCNRALAYSGPFAAALTLRSLAAAQPASQALAPLGAGTDAVLGASEDCSWIALRHVTPGPAVTEQHLLYAPATGRRIPIRGPADSAIEFAGFLPSSSAVAR